MNNFTLTRKEEVVDLVEQLQQIIGQEYANYPEDLIEQILQQREHETPKLLKIVEEFVKSSSRVSTYNQWREATVAFFILAKLSEQRAFPYLVQLCLLPHENVEPVLGDLATEYMHKFLASTFNGDLKALYAIVSNKNLNEYVRSAALASYVILYKYDAISYEQIRKVFSRLFTALHDDFSRVPTKLVLACHKIHATELYEQIKKYFDDQLVRLDPSKLDEIQDDFALPENESLIDLDANSYFACVDNLKYDLGWLFHTKAENTEEDEVDEAEDIDAKVQLGMTIGRENRPYVHVTPLSGRNDPCPCGSGKKYKRCCCR